MQIICVCMHCSIQVNTLKNCLEGLENYANFTWRIKKCIVGNVRVFFFFSAH